MKWVLCIIAMSVIWGYPGEQQGYTTHTDVRDTSITNLMRAGWRERMWFAEQRKAMCVSGHWRESDTTFVIDSLSKPKKDCRFGASNYQGMLGFMELDVDDTYETLLARWKLIVMDHPHCLFIGAVVGLSPTKRPIVWGYQRRDDAQPDGAAAESTTAKP